MSKIFKNVQNFQKCQIFKNVKCPKFHFFHDFGHNCSCPITRDCAFVYTNLFRYIFVDIKKTSPANEPEPLFQHALHICLAFYVFRSFGPRYCFYNDDKYRLTVMERILSFFHFEISIPFDLGSYSHFRTPL